MTLRELTWAYESRRDYDWDHTSHILAEIANGGFGRKVPVHPKERNPYYQRKKLPAVPIGNLKGLFVEGFGWQDKAEQSGPGVR